jgi:hypothetical protein
MADSLDALVGKIDPVCTLDEVCAVLKMSRRNANRLRKIGAFPVPEMQPAFDDRPRFSGEDVIAAIRARSDYGKSKRWLRPTV